MKLSKYVKKIEFDNDNLVLHNLFNGALYLISKADMEHLETELCDGKLLESKHIPDLLNELFIVEDEPIHECSRIADEILHTIETTSECNMQCSYCYENDKGSRKPVSSEVIEKTLRYVKNVFEQDETKKKLCIGFIGGEPLLCKETVRLLCEKFMNLGEKYDRKISFHIDTNGTIPFADLYDSLENLQVSVSLTPKKDHNKNRIGKGFDSYDVIVKNLKDVINKSSNRLVIRYNTNDENINLFKDFVKFVRENIPICDTVEPMYTDEYEHTIFKNMLDIEVFKRWNSSEAIDILTENGYYVPYTLGGKLSMCIAYQKYSCKVYADGQVTLCDSMLHKDARCNISQICDMPEQLEHYYLEIKNYNPLDSEKCSSCVSLSRCMGELFCRKDKCDYNRRFNDDVLICTFVRYFLEGKAEFFTKMIS